WTELLQRPRAPLRLRGGRQEHPGSLSRGEEGRGGSRGSRCPRGRGGAVRAEGANPRAPADLEKFGGDHADLRCRPDGGAAPHGRARPLSWREARRFTLPGGAGRARPGSTRGGAVRGGAHLAAGRGRGGGERGTDREI